jgi:ankyrin repeat protein
LVRNHPTIIDSLNIENQSAIQVAAKQGHFDCCKTLLDANCDGTLLGLVVWSLCC